MLVFFEERHLLAPEGTEQLLLLESARSVAKVAATPSCPARGIADGPIGNVIVRAIDLPVDPRLACRDAPDSELCEGIVDGCRATEEAIFCDRRWVTEIVALAAVSRRAAVSSIQFEDKGVTIAPDDLLPSSLEVPLLDYWRALRSTDRIGSVQQPPPISEAMGSTMSPTVHALARALLAFGVGHEFAHLVQQACPAENHLSSDVSEGYREFSCGETSDVELAADLEGIDLARRVLIDLHPPVPPEPTTFTEVTDTTSIKNRGADTWLSEHWTDAVATGLIDYAEVSALSEFLGADASKTVRTEPALGRAPLSPEEKALLEESRRHEWTVLGNEETDRLLLFSQYYARLAQASTTRPKAFEHHLPLPYRLYLLQTEFAGTEWDLAADRQQSRNRGLRFAGLLRELLPAMQARCNRRSDQEKARIGEEWLGGKLAGRQPMYFEGNAMVCRSRELLQQVVDHKLELSAKDLLYGSDCGIPASARISVHRQEAGLVEFSYAGVPEVTFWTKHTAISPCPRPKPRNLLLTGPLTKQVMCDVIRDSLSMVEGRVKLRVQLAKLLLERSTGARRVALDSSVEKGDHCVLAEMRSPESTEECVIELRGPKDKIACAVDLNAFAQCWALGGTEKLECPHHLACGATLP